MDPAVSFRRVSYRAGGTEVLREMTLDVREGETLVLLGRSGSGKTTALKMVNRLLVPSSGEVRVEGDRKSTRLNSSHIQKSRMPSSA